jgi:hypothetical protein
MVRVALLVILSAILTSACATSQPPPGAPRADAPNPPAPGSTWVFRDRNSGSFGSETRERTVRALGEQAWQGRTYRAVADADVTSYFDLATGGVVVRARGSSPVESYDPPLAWQWPIFPGKSWMQSWRYTNHERGRTNDVNSWFKIERYEEVTVPAGTFKTFAISVDDGFFRATTWWSPDLGIPVRVRQERYGNHFLGTGTSETDLLSHQIKR